MLQPDWTSPFLNYLLQGTLPTNTTEACNLTRCAKAFVIVGEEMYKHSPSGILQKCIPANQGWEMLLEIHVGIYNHHAAPRSLMGKAFHQGFY